MEQAGSRIRRVRPGAHGRARLKDPVDGGRGPGARRRRAHVLLPGDGDRPNGGWTDAGTADAPGTSVVTAERTGGRCVMEGLDAALDRRERANRKGPGLDGEGQATPGMPGCPEPSEGHARWTLRPRGERLVELETVDGISKETVRQAPRKTAPGPGWGKCRCIPPKGSAGSVAAMEDVPGTCALGYGCNGTASPFMVHAPPGA